MTRLLPSPLARSGGDRTAGLAPATRSAFKPSVAAFAGAAVEDTMAQQGSIIGIGSADRHVEAQ